MKTTIIMHLFTFFLGFSSFYIIKFLISTWNKYFVPQRIKIEGEIIDIKKDFDFLPSSLFSSFNDNALIPSFYIYPFVKRVFYVVKVLQNNNYCFVRISLKTFRKIKRLINKGNNFFSYNCEKEWLNDFYTLIEEN